MTDQVDPVSFGDEQRAKRVALLNERIALIERTESFDRRWWRAGRVCNWLSQTFTLAAVALFAAGFFCENWWPAWPAWGALVAGQAFGWGLSIAARVTIKRKLAAVDEMAELNDRVRSELLGEGRH